MSMPNKTITEQAIAAIKQNAHTCADCGLLHKKPTAGRFALLIGSGVATALITGHGAKNTTGATKVALRSLSVTNWVGIAAFTWSASVFTTHVMTTTKGDDDPGSTEEPTATGATDRHRIYDI